MSEPESRRSAAPTFSLMHLLILTALIAIGTAVGSAYHQNRSMIQQRDELLSLSSRLKIENEQALASAEMPRVADSFHSWQVHVPDGAEYELRLGIGAVSAKSIPPMVGSVRLAAGRHRVTLHSADSPTEKFRYVVYVDGKQAIEKTMGGDWIPGGWSSASGIDWPRGSMPSPAPHQLSARSYRAKIDLGSGNYFNGQSDDYVTRNGYRLWIDQPARSWTPASPFMGPPHDPLYQGVGLRDGLRFSSSSRPPYVWKFTRPKSDTIEPVLQIAAEFLADDGTLLSSQTQSFQSWQLRSDARGENALKWETVPSQSAYTAFLQAKLTADGAPQPVVEMKWDASRPDEVGLRIADTPANDQVKQWRLRILEGTKHLWRELQIGDRTVNADKVPDDSGTKSTDAAIALDPGDGTEDTRLRWQTDETLPLQILERRQTGYSGMGLYKGLPQTFGVQIPASLKPTLTVTVIKEDPNAPGNPFPGGTVLDEIEIGLDATSHDWIWLEAKSKN
ncbi:MAG: hypothetical protein ACO1RT_08120 [Planctomycetaceae bacterium]